MTTRQLFRDEAVAQRGQQFLGPILLVRPLAFRLITAAAALFALGIIAVVFFVEYTQKATIAGTLAPREGLVAVNAPAGGIVLERRVEEGQSVRKGEVLFVVSAERRSAAQEGRQALIGAQLRQRRSALAAERDRQKAIMLREEQAVRAKLADLTAELGELQSQIDAQTARLESIDATLQRFETLRTEGHVSLVQVQEKREHRLSEQAALHGLKRDRLALERDATELRNEIESMPLRLNSQLTSIEDQMAEIEQDLASAESEREFVLEAHQDGIITALGGDPGSAVIGNERLAVIVPQGATLEAQLHAASRDVGFIVPGKRVQLRYHSYPYQKFGQFEGRVIDVSATTVAPEEGESGGSHHHDPVYVVQVELPSQQIEVNGRRYPLHAGMQVDAAVLLDRRRLIEWIFEPVLGFSNRMADQHD
jgi:membrane fusion protein